MGRKKKESGVGSQESDPPLLTLDTVCEAAALSGLLLEGQDMAALVQHLSREPSLPPELRARCTEKVRAWLNRWDAYGKASAAPHAPSAPG